MLTLDERKFILEAFIANNKSPTVALRKISTRWPNKKKPSLSAVTNLYQKYQLTGSVANNNSNKGRPISARSPDKVEALKSLVNRSTAARLPSSTRKLAQVVGMSATSAHKILRENKLKPFKPHYVQKLNEDNFNTRFDFANEICNLVQDENFDYRKIIFTDEAHFDLNGVVNRQNTRYWAAENPMVEHERTSHAPRVTVLCGICDKGLIGPFIFTESVKTAFYEQLLREKVIPRCRRMGLMRDYWFQQDGAPPHCAPGPLAILNDAFKGRIISRKGKSVSPIAIEWPPYSPDLTACDFFLWGYLKSKVYATRPNTLESLQRAIKRECRQVSAETCASIFENFMKRVHTTIAADGKHIERRIK